MVSLVKGQKVDLTKGNAGLKKILVGLGWDTNKYDGSEIGCAATVKNINGINFVTHVRTNPTV